MNDLSQMPSTPCKPYMIKSEYKRLLLLQELRVVNKQRWKAGSKSYRNDSSWAPEI